MSDSGVCAGVCSRLRGAPALLMHFHAPELGGPSIKRQSQRRNQALMAVLRQTSGNIQEREDCSLSFP